jgi:metal-sulfur cluster biosynthetic enzyme
MMEQDALAAEVKQALAMVVDPELGENVVDLGLIYAIAVEEGVARVEMTTTTQGCPATAFLKEAVQAAAWGVPGIHYADVTLTYEPKWAPAMMSEAARRNLGNR